MSEPKVIFADGAEDFQQAEWLSDEKFGLKREWRYDFTKESWHHYIPESGQWLPDQVNVILREVASLAARSLNPKDSTVPDPDTDAARKARTKLMSIPAAERALKALATFDGYGTDGNDWDSDPFLLGCTNGVVDLRTNAFVADPGPHHLVTKSTKHPFEPIKSYKDALRRAPTFMRVLEEWTSGDRELAGFLLDWFGAGLFGMTPEQRFLLMTGRGRNGKGALKAGILAALGEYAGEPSANLYMKSHFGAARSDQARADLINLKGLRVAFFSDPEGHKFNEELLKAHTGGDRISARALHSNNVQSWEPTHSVTFLLNDAPELDDLGPSMAGRVMVADFREDYSLNPDKNLYGHKEAKLNREAPGVLAILVEAAASWFEKWTNDGAGLVLPPRVVEQSKQFMERNDVIANWMSERCEVGIGLSCPSQLAYESYLNWHSRSGEEGEAMSMVRWALAVNKKRFEKEKTRTGVVWKGFKLLGAMALADKGIDEDEEP